MESDLFNGSLPFPVNFTTIAIALAILLAIIAFVRGVIGMFVGIVCLLAGAIRRLLVSFADSRVDCRLYRATLPAFCIFCRPGDWFFRLHLPAPDGRCFPARPDAKEEERPAAGEECSVLP